MLKDDETEEEEFFDALEELPTMPNWKNIDPDFTERIQWEWTDKGFTYSQAHDWVNIGLKPSEADFAYWLEQEGYTALSVLDYGDAEYLRKDYEEHLLNPRPKRFNPPKPNWKLIITLVVLTALIIYLLTK